MKSLTRIIAFLIILCGCVACSVAEDGHLPGDEFDTRLIISENPQDAVAVLFDIEYDHSALEIEGEETQGVCFSGNSGSIIDLDGLKYNSGMNVRVHVLSDAEEGQYTIQIRIKEAVDLNEKQVVFPVFSPCIISVEKQKSRIQVGETIVFGHYEQDKDSANGSEGIEWLVLDQRDSQALLISKYGLDSVPYDDIGNEVTWEDCSIRKWLNQELYNTAFNEDEQNQIISSSVDNSQAQSYPRYKTESGNNTTDKVFLLSYAEAWEYLKTDDARICQPTAYAIERGAYVGKEGYGWWWLRSPGAQQDCAVRISDNGSRTSSKVHEDKGCVRPVIIIQLR